jgi:c-di-GMP-binding flagellar brake protein YcgR
MEQSVNRRRWQRFPFDASVRVVVDHTADATVVDGRGVRFSEGGICLFAAANLPVGSQVKVEFRTPHTDEPVRVRGKVRNRSVYLYGVEFLSDKFEDRQQLARLSAEFRGGSLPSA